MTELASKNKQLLEASRNNLPSESSASSMLKEQLTENARLKAELDALRKEPAASSSSSHSSVELEAEIAILKASVARTKQENNALQQKVLQQVAEKEQWMVCVLGCLFFQLSDP